MDKTELMAISEVEPMLVPGYNEAKEATPLGEAIRP